MVAERPRPDIHFCQERTFARAGGIAEAGDDVAYRGQVDDQGRTVVVPRQTGLFTTGPRGAVEIPIRYPFDVDQSFVVLRRLAVSSEREELLDSIVYFRDCSRTFFVVGG